MAYDRRKEGKWPQRPFPTDQSGVSPVQKELIAVPCFLPLSFERGPRSRSLSSVYSTSLIHISQSYQTLSPNCWTAQISFARCLPGYHDAQSWIPTRRARHVIKPEHLQAPQLVFSSPPPAPRNLHLSSEPNSPYINSVSQIEYPKSDIPDGDLCAALEFDFLTGHRL